MFSVCIHYSQLNINDICINEIHFKAKVENGATLKWYTHFQQNSVSYIMLSYSEDKQNSAQQRSCRECLYNVYYRTTTVSMLLKTHNIKECMCIWMHAHLLKSCVYIYACPFT